MDTRTIVIGNVGADFVSIVAGQPGVEGWFGADIEMRCDGWYGKTGASFMKGELRRLAQDLRSLQHNLSGTATFKPLEPHVQMHFAGDGKGHIVVEGEACIRFESGTRLHFLIDIDQTYLGGIITALFSADPA